MIAGTDVSHVAAMVDFALTRYPSPNANLYVNQPLRLFSNNVIPQTRSR